MTSAIAAPDIHAAGLKGGRGGRVGRGKGGKGEGGKGEGGRGGGVFDHLPQECERSRRDDPDRARCQIHLGLVLKSFMELHHVWVVRP